jgi:hypothetical protein
MQEIGTSGSVAGSCNLVAFSTLRMLSSPVKRPRYHSDPDVMLAAGVADRAFELEQGEQRSGLGWGQPGRGG